LVRKRGRLHALSSLRGGRHDHGNAHLAAPCADASGCANCRQSGLERAAGQRALLLRQLVSQLLHPMQRLW
jgi:hypothetical protein